MNPLQACQLDSQGYYVGIVYATESPLQEGVYLFPSLSVKINPPAQVAGKRYKFDKGGWVEEGISNEENPNLEYVVTMRQARIALHRAGFLQSIDDFLKLQGSVEDKIEWEYATEVSSENPLVKTIKNKLGISDEGIRNIFSSAAKI